MERIDRFLKARTRGQTALLLIPAAVALYLFGISAGKILFYVVGAG